MLVVCITTSLLFQHEQNNRDYKRLTVSPLTTCLSVCLFLSQILHFTFFESQIDCVLFLFTDWLCSFFSQILDSTFFESQICCVPFWSHILHFTFFKFSRLPVDHSKAVFLVPTDLVEKTVFRRYRVFRASISEKIVMHQSMMRHFNCQDWR